MARHWETTKIEMLCGGCAKYLEKRSPVQVIELPGVKKKHFRGPCCADNEIPSDIPEGPTERELLAERVESIRSIGARVIREWMPFKENREPGEDG